MCVCHLHAPHARALGIAGKPLKPVFLHGSFLCTGVPTWNNPRLVVNDEQAADLSRALAGHRAAQMRGHGSVVAGATAEEAFSPARSWKRTRKSSCKPRLPAAPSN